MELSGLASCDRHTNKWHTSVLPSLKFYGLFTLSGIDAYGMMPLLSHVWLFATPWTTAHQAPLCMGFSRQEYWSGLPFPPPGDLPDPGTNLSLLWILCGRRILYSLNHQGNNIYASSEGLWELLYACTWLPGVIKSAGRRQGLCVLQMLPKWSDEHTCRGKSALERFGWWLSCKESACRCRRHGFNPWPRKIMHATEQWSPRTTTTETVLYSLGAATTEALAAGSPRCITREATTTKSSPCAVTREKAQAEMKTQHNWINYVCVCVCVCV